jgi:hypothetical protein
MFFHSSGGQGQGRGVADYFRAAMIMSDKIKPDQAASLSGEPQPEPVPEWLGNRLRRMFTDVMDEPVPDEFKALLKQLEDKEKERGS